MCDYSCFFHGCRKDTPFAQLIEQSTDTCDQQMQTRVSKFLTRVERTKILILGNGSAGKSALLWSLQRYRNDPLTAQGLQERREVIRHNLIWAIITLLRQSEQLYEYYDESCIDQDCADDIIHYYHSHLDPHLLQCHVDLNTDTVQKIELIIKCINDRTTFEDLKDEELQQIAIALNTLWNLSAVQQTFLLRCKRYYSFYDNMDYFFNKVHDVMSAGYVPTEEDTLKWRIRTTGLMEYEYNHNGNPCVIFDVGGVRNERKKWVQCFEGVNAVLYVCPLNEYCLSLFEDEKELGLRESLALFEEVCNLKWFRKSVFVLLLNKTDLFRENLRITPLTLCFGDEYKGRNFNDAFMDKNDLKTASNLMMKILMHFLDGEHMEAHVPRDVVMVIAWYFNIRESDWWLNLCYQDGIEFITQKCLSLNENMNQRIYVYEVCAVIPQQVGKIMEEVQGLIAQNEICKAQFLL
eukprot:165467_1